MLFNIDQILTRTAGFQRRTVDERAARLGEIYKSVLRNFPMHLAADLVATDDTDGHG